MNPDLRWCDLCKAPVTEFARRPRIDGGGVGPLRHDQLYYRWARSPTTFGPFGRIACTVVMFLLGPWTANPGFALIWTPAWVAVSVVVLRSVWRKVPVEVSPHSADGKAGQDRLLEPVGGRWLGAAFMALGAIGYAFALIRLGTAARFTLIAITACVILGLAFARMIEG